METMFSVKYEEERIDDEVIPLKYSITSYGADYTVDGLVKRISNGDIYVPPFQRRFVWSLKQGSRFIESLLLGLPVPGIFLAKEYNTQKHLVIDGQQRLRTLQNFYEGVWAPTQRVFALRGVQRQFEGVTYKTLKSEDRRRLDDSILHATIVRQDEPSDDNSSVYYIFERLNTGGTLLKPQEIRSCIYHGEFNDLIKQLNQDEKWRAIYGKVDERMRDEELILRFFALYFKADKYAKPMKEFLNKYMGGNRHFKMQSKETLNQLFINSIGTIYAALGKTAFKPEGRFVAAIFDSVTVAVAKRLEKGKISDYGELRKNYQALLNNKEYIDASSTHTTDEDKVKTRITLATKALADIK
jgi:hypothetical protein